MKTPSNIATAINSEHDAAQACHEQAVRHAIKCGKLLADAKVLLPYGKWAAWVKGRIARLAMRTAQVYMRIAAILAGDV